MSHLDEIDWKHPDLGDLYDELPLWSAPFGLLLLAEAPLRSGQRILDVGAGTGFLTVELAQRCGARATVFAVDPWSAAMARLRRKIEALGLTNVVLLEQDAATLALPGGSIDLIVSNLGVNNFDNPAAVLSACHRVARTGASLVLTTNLVGHMAEFYDVFRATLVELGHADRLEALEAHIRHRGTVESVSAMIEEPGFCVRDVKTGSFPMRFAGGGALLRHYFIRLGFLPGWKAVAPPESCVEVFERLERNLDAVAAKRGDLTLTIPMACVTATKEA